MFRRVAGVVGLVALLALGACDKIQRPVGHKAGAGADWTTHNGDAGETAFSQLDQVDRDSVARLGLAWAMDLSEGTLEATPVAADGVIYFTGSRANVYAVDGVTGKLLWTFDPETWKFAPNKMMYSFSVNRGVAYAGGRIFSAALDGRLFALDAKTGKTLWSVQTTPLDSPETITGAPRVFKDKVLIGQGGADFGARGYVTAYDQASGKQVWRTYMVPGTPEQNRGDPAMERAAATWHGQYWKTGTGGAAWDGLTFDPELNRVYIGTANAGPWDPDLRSPGGGDNLYTAAIVALDADTGKYVWWYQTTPRDSWDYDATQQMTLAELSIAGKRRKVLMQAPKNGFFYVIDRESGKLISAEKFGKVTWAERIDPATGRPVEAKNVHYETGEVTVWPSSIGAHTWHSMAFNPASGLVYIPYMQVGVRLTRGQPVVGQVAMNGITVWGHAEGPGDGQGALVAWDPIRQKEVWRAQHTQLWNGGAMTTAGGLVFQGDAEGWFAAYDAATGKRLWQFYAGEGIVGAPMTFSAKGKQYVSVLSGYGGAVAAWVPTTLAGWKYAGPHRLLTFTLDGKAVPPPTPQPDKTVHALDVPGLKIDPADVAAGAKVYAYCGACHGLYLQSPGGPGPDLRESALALDPENLWSVLHDGALMSRGMPRFAMLSREQVAKLYIYIRAGARQAASDPGKVSPTAPEAPRSGLGTR